MADIPHPQTLQELIDEVRKAFDQDKVDVDYVKTVMSNYKSNYNDWKQYALWDPHRYTRNLVDSGNGKYNLILLCWAEGQGSGVHDHMNAHCFLKVMQGTLRETMFDWPKEADGVTEPVKERFSNDYHTDQVTYINDTIGLHRVENPSHSERAVSLHLYCPPFDHCHGFDERTGQKRTCQVTFYSKYGERTPFPLQELQTSNQSVLLGN